MKINATAIQAAHDVAAKHVTEHGPVISTFEGHIVESPFYRVLLETKDVLIDLQERFPGFRAPGEAVPAATS